jgi:two-component system sensor kinase FixL
MVLISVHDTGPGLSPRAFGELFSPFVSSKADGMGIGLSICRTIIEGHGGQIWAEAPGDGGATLRFTVPAAPAR